MTTHMSVLPGTAINTHQWMREPYVRANFEDFKGVFPQPKASGHILGGHWATDGSLVFYGRLRRESWRTQPPSALLDVPAIPSSTGLLDELSSIGTWNMEEAFEMKQRPGDEAIISAPPLESLSACSRFNADLQQSEVLDETSSTTDEIFPISANRLTFELQMKAHSSEENPECKKQKQIRDVWEVEEEKTLLLVAMEMPKDCELKDVSTVAQTVGINRPVGGIEKKFKRLCGEKEWCWKKDRMKFFQKAAWKLEDHQEAPSRKLKRSCEEAVNSFVAESPAKKKRCAA